MPGSQVRDAIAVGLDWHAANARSAELLARLVPVGCRVLDAGCGCGDLRPVLAGREYVGVDLVPEFIAVARVAHPGDRFEVADLRDLSRFADDEFDAVVLRGVGGTFAKSPDILPGLLRIARRVVILSTAADQVDVIDR